MASKQTANKDQVIKEWDSVTPLNDSGQYYAELSDLKSKDNKLYEFAFSLAAAYTNAHTKNNTYNNICDYFNEWLNTKKDNYTSDGTLYENNKLWDTYIEVLWVKLEDDKKGGSNNIWCPRNPTKYECHISSKNPISVSFSLFLMFRTIRSWIYRYITKKGTMSPFIDDEVSQEPLENSEHIGSQIFRRKINLVYNTEVNT
ncbi:PIR Superfamily Protein [Plasmodium ovale curtisi]|uniref:PIR Superfamily Protein n=1 Tax=Plasmodium ovale curtisi TaxID=864141 RepID=A0A1A8X0M0_PLAOA|nr:PIR Superfamily Protein [Plasmodium ovale curtisi]SBS98789.1 PIR Superfamily Protein [Plasmodium ovale curtisi]